MCEIVSNFPSIKLRHGEKKIRYLFVYILHLRHHFKRVLAMVFRAHVYETGAERVMGWGGCDRSWREGGIERGFSSLLLD